VLLIIAAVAKREGHPLVKFVAKTKCQPKAITLGLAKNAEPVCSREKAKKKKKIVGLLSCPVDRLGTPHWGKTADNLSCLHDRIRHPMACNYEPSPCVISHHGQEPEVLHICNLS
jgi:hypothetical protein